MAVPPGVGQRPSYTGRIQAVVAKRAQARDMGLLAWLAVAVAQLVALGIRLYQIDEPPLGFQS